jgi:hypothetical protein
MQMNRNYERNLSPQKPERPEKLLEKHFYETKVIGAKSEDYSEWPTLEHLQSYDNKSLMKLKIAKIETAAFDHEAELCGIRITLNDGTKSPIFGDFAGCELRQTIEFPPGTEITNIYAAYDESYVYRILMHNQNHVKFCELGAYEFEQYSAVTDFRGGKRFIGIRVFGPDVSGIQFLSFETEFKDYARTRDF